MTLLETGKSMTVSVVVFFMTAGVAMAQDASRFSSWSWYSFWRNRYGGSRFDNHDRFSQVPEIDASTGLLALAAVAAALVLVWELRRRRKKA